MASSSDWRQWIRHFYGATIKTKLQSGSVAEAADAKSDRMKHFPVLLDARTQMHAGRYEQ